MSFFEWMDSAWYISLAVHAVVGGAAGGFVAGLMAWHGRRRAKRRKQELKDFWHSKAVQP